MRTRQGKSWLRRVFHQQSHRLGITPVRMDKPHTRQEVCESDQRIKSAQQERGIEKSWLVPIRLSGYAQEILIKLQSTGFDIFRQQRVE